MRRGTGALQLPGQHGLAAGISQQLGQMLERSHRLAAVYEKGRILMPCICRVDDSFTGRVKNPGEGGAASVRSKAGQESSWNTQR